VSASFPASGKPAVPAHVPPTPETDSAKRQISDSRKPTILVGSGVRDAGVAVRKLAELLQCPVFTTTTGKGMFAGDHPLSLGCISRLGAVQDIFLESDLLISFGARLTEFDTGRFGLKLPLHHIQVIEDARYAGERTVSARIVGDITGIAKALVQRIEPHSPWCDIAG